MLTISFLFCCISYAQEDFADRYNPWRSVQEKVSGAVVQIFTQSTPVNLLHPYSMPDQESSGGSGFFINEDGDIITNAHVVDQAVGIWIQIPTLGKRPIRVELVSTCPGRDLALLRLTQEGRAFVSQAFGKIPFLVLGNSDLARRADEVLALGYPLCQESLKSTTGVMNGMEQNFIQIDAAINPGSSGGPLLNFRGEVIGINSSGIKSKGGVNVDNVSYAIPVNVLKLVLDAMYEFPLLREPFLGFIMTRATDEMTEYLGNPHPGGFYVAEVNEDGPMHRAGLRSGDMLYEIDGYRLDIYGEMFVPWSEDKVSILNYISRLKVGQQVDWVVYRAGERMEFTLTVTQKNLPAVRQVHPGYDKVDYEIFAGMVVMQLTENHIQMLAGRCPGLFRYLETKRKHIPVLVVTHVFHNSEVSFSRTVFPGVTLNEVNGIPVQTLDDFRKAVKQGATSNYFVVRGSDNISCATDNFLAVHSMEKIINQEFELARAYRYTPTSLIQEVVMARGA